MATPGETRRERRSMRESLRWGWRQAAKQESDRESSDARQQRARRVPRACPTICTAFGLLAATATARANVIISEYVEGASNDKAIELYNSGPSSVDLASGGYVLSVFFNGNTSAATTIALAGTVPAGGVFVYAHSGASPAILAQADQTSAAALWNGDDAIELSADGSVVDSFGQVGVDPGTQWPGGGENDTLRRKAAFCAGDTN